MIRVRAPASSANLGPGFDCVAVALALWNELEVEEKPGELPDETRLGVRAFRLFAPTKGRSFTFTDRIGALRGVSRSLLQNHLKHCAAEAIRSNDHERSEASRPHFGLPVRRGMYW